MSAASPTHLRSCSSPARQFQCNSDCNARLRFPPAPLRARKQLNVRTLDHLTSSSARNDSRRKVSVLAIVPKQSPVIRIADKESCSHVATTLISRSSQALDASLSLWLLSSLPALAVDDFSQSSASSGSYYATLFLFVATLPGLWSLVKRAPKASKKRKVFEVPGPKSGKDVMPLDTRARQVFAYFKKYNYEVRERGEVITFVGNYAASRGQAAALVFYVFFGLASAALVLSIAAPFGGNWWYGITLISPAAGAYYLRKGDREEEFKVKMVTADDEMTTDIVTSGDVEETSRFCKELGLTEKGKEYVKGILER